MKTKRFPWNAAKGIICGQAALVVLLFLLSYLFWGEHISRSVGLGALVCWLPNVLFYSLAFKYFGAQSAKEIVGAFYLGEALKLGVTVLLLSVCLMQDGVEPRALILGFLIIQLSTWILSVFSLLFKR